MSDNTEIRKEDLKAAVGGFEYDGCLEWLKGHNISCPGCGNDDEGTITKRYATGLHIYYTCESCGQKFYYTLNANNKVKAYKE